MKSQLYFSFWRSNHLVRKGSPDLVQIAILPQFLAIEPDFVQKGCARTRANENRTFTSVFGGRTSFRAKGLRPDARNRIFTLLVFSDRTSFRAKWFAGRVAHCNFSSGFRDRTSFRAKGLRPDARNRIFTLVFGDRTSFRAKWFAGRVADRNFTAAFGDRSSFRAKGLRFVQSRWHCPAPSREK